MLENERLVTPPQLLALRCLADRLHNPWNKGKQTTCDWGVDDEARDRNRPNAKLYLMANREWGLVPLTKRDYRKLEKLGLVHTTYDVCGWGVKRLNVGITNEGVRYLVLNGYILPLKKNKKCA